MSNLRFSTEKFKPFKPFNRSAQSVSIVQVVPNVQAPPRITSGAGSLFLPRDAGEDEEGGLNRAQRLNDLNVLNAFMSFTVAATDRR
jgi:hypothetical protein